MERLKRDAEKRGESLRRAREEREAEQLGDATFAPKTTKCPTYITRIAHGMKVQRKADQRNQLTTATDKQWR